MPLTARFPHFYYAILQLSKFRLTTKGFFFLWSLVLVSFPLSLLATSLFKELNPNKPYILDIIALLCITGKLCC